jgi:flagellar assembly factor FliW
MRIETAGFGLLDVKPERIIAFPEFLPGFPARLEYALLEMGENSPFKFLQSLEDPSLAITIGEARTLVPGYQPSAAPEELEPLRIEETDRVDLYLVTVVAEDPLESTVNLQAPVVVNRTKRLGKQVVLQNESYPLRYCLFGRKKRAVAGR